MATRPSRPSDARKTHFGITAILMAAASSAFLLAYFGIAQLDITPSEFFELNQWVTLSYCLASPAAFFLGVIGLTRRNDSGLLSWISIGLVGVPFLVIFWQFMESVFF